MQRPIRYSVLLFASLAAAGAQTLIDNDQVKVIKVVDQPHVKTPPHEHKVNRVMVYLNAGKQEFMTSGHKSMLEFKAGDALWSAATGTHTGEIMSASPVTIVEIEIKKPGDPAKAVNVPLDPLKVDPKHYHLEFENLQVRVARVRFGAHESAPLHEHVLNRVVVYLTDQDSRMTVDGKAETTQHKAGEASWGGPVKHKEDNLMDKPFEGVVIELKN